MAVAIAQEMKESMLDAFIAQEEANVGFGLYLFTETVAQICSGLSQVDQVTRTQLVTATSVGGTGSDRVIFDHGQAWQDVILESYDAGGSITAWGLRNQFSVTVTTEATQVNPAPTDIKSYAIVYNNLTVSNANCKVLMVGDFTSTITINSGDTIQDYTIPAGSIAFVAD